MQGRSPNRGRPPLRGGSEFRPAAALPPSQLTDALLALARLRAADAVFARLLRPEAGVMRAAVQWPGSARQWVAAAVGSACAPV